MFKSFSVSVLLILSFVVFETAILSNIIIFPAVPDFLLIISLYLSLHNGRLFGVSAGFVSGIFLDFLSASPFGLNSLLRTIIGYAAGCFNKTLNTSGIILPALLGFIATFLKILILFIISIFFADSVSSYSIFSKAFCFEIIANSLLTPLVFMFLNIFRDVILLNPENVN